MRRLFATALGVLSVLGLALPSSGTPQPPWYFGYDFASKGVVAYWPFDGNSQDVTGSGYDGILNGDATTTPSPLGQALTLDGSGDFVKIEGHVPYGNEYTFSGWALFNSSSSDNINNCVHIFAKLGTASRAAQSLTLGSTPSQGLPPWVLVNVSDFGFPWYLVHTPTTREDNRWVHYVATARPGEVNLYIDGGLVETSNFTGTLDHSFFAGNFIGGHHDIPQQWDRCSHNGQIDDVVVFDRAISPAEVVALATDANGDGVADFWVSPVPPTPEELIVAATDEIVDLVDTGILTGGQGNALAGKLDDALAKFNSGKTKPALNKLNAFINQVTALIADDTLTQIEGDALIAFAQAIIDAIILGG